MLEFPWHKTGCPDVNVNNLDQMTDDHSRCPAKATESQVTRTWTIGHAMVDHSPRVGGSSSGHAHACLLPEAKCSITVI